MLTIATETMKGVLAYRGKYYFFSRILFAGKVASIFQLSYHSDQGFFNFKY